MKGKLMCSQDWKDSPDGPGWYHLALLKRGGDSYTRGVGNVYHIPHAFPGQAAVQVNGLCMYELQPESRVGPTTVSTHYFFDGDKLERKASIAYDDVKYLAIDTPTLPSREAILERDRLREPR